MRPLAAARPGVAVLLALLATLALYAFAFSSEAGVGTLRGRVLAADTGRPLAGMRVVIRPADPRSGTDARRARTDREGFFTVHSLPIGGYEVVTTATAYRNGPQSVTVQEGQVAAPVLQLQPGDPELQMFVHRHANLPEDEPRIALRGFRQGDRITMRLYSVDPMTLLNEDGDALRKLLQPVAWTRRRGGAGTFDHRKLKRVREWPHPVEKRDAEGVFYDYVHLGHLPPGVYVAAAHGAKNDAIGWLMVTDLALVTKSARGRVEAFTANLKSGDPVPGAAVTLYRGSARLAAQTTDPRGLARFTLSSTSQQGVAAVARRGSALAFMNVFPFGEGDRDRLRVFTYTDRPIYRPGHRVRFKGVVRRLQGSGYALPEAGSVEMRILDDQETEIWTGHVTLNERGSYSGEFGLPREAHSGMYTVESKIAGERHTAEFSVASYRKPEWRVEVRTEKPHYVRGEQVPVTVRATYYYGAPVATGKVHYTVYRAPYWSWREEDGDSDPGDEDASAGFHGEVVASGDTTTDADGAARFTFPTSTADDRNTTLGSGEPPEFQYTIEAGVADLSNREASGRGQVRVASGLLTLSARPGRYVVQPGETVTVIGSVKDLDDKPVPNAEVTAAATLDLFVAGRSTEKALLTRTVRTDARGDLRVQLPAAETGNVLVKLTTRDPRGNVVTADTSVWVTTADGGDYEARVPALGVIPDKKQYRVGDTAQILLNTDKPGATALVAIEAEQVHDLRQVRLKSRSTVVRFPIRGGYEPNVYLSACFVRNREFIINRVRIQVNVEAHRLQVTVESDREQYRPGDLATFRVRTADAQGRPVPAEVSLGVVDEAVYAIREEPKRGLWETFYPRRWDQVRTEFSFPQIFLGDADKDGANVQIRKEFPDTALWNPTLLTGRMGTATVRLKMPDSLTSWRATAVAHTAATSVGRGVRTIRVAKELTLRLQLPRTITQGDHLTLSAVAHNYSAAPLQAAVELRAAGLRVEGHLRRSVHLSPGAAERVTWSASADAPGPAIVTALATAGALSDGVRLGVQVRPFVRERVYYHTGAVTDAGAREEFEMDGAAQSAELELRFSPTLAGSILGSLEYLATYPYGCTEQTMSSFLPDVMISRTLRGLELHRPGLQNRLPEMTRAGLLRLYGYQHPDGGWGWWEYDQTDPWMTGYVLFGLTTAREAGIPVNPRIYENGLRAAGELVRRDKLAGEEGMLLAYALARAGAPARSRALFARFPTAGSHLSRRATAYRILALESTGSAAERKAAAELMEELWRASLETGGVIHWTEAPTREPAHRPDDAEVTGLALKAAMVVTPDDSRLPGVVRWLLLNRQGSKWESTRDTAWILFGLADYLKRSGDLRAEYHLSVRLNEREIYADDFRPGDAFQPETLLRVKRAELQGRNRLEIRRTGTGTAYYTLQWRQAVSAPGMSSESALPGFSVSREYYKLETRRDDAGRISVVPERSPSRRFRVGDRILAQVRIHTERPLDFLMLEDPLPTGCEVQDRGQVPADEWTDWWCHMDVRDDRVNTFIRHLDSGTHTVQYYLRPEVAARQRVLPAQVSDMYVPSTRCSTADMELEVDE